jgi:hypothetical protein
MKYLCNREQVFEFFNPVLDGSSTGGTNIQYNNCNDMIDVPDWLNPDIDPDADVTLMHGDITSIGTFHLNGVPLSSWSAQRGGSVYGYDKKNSLQQWYYVNALTQYLFPDGIQAYVNGKNSVQEIEIDKLTILKMVPLNIGIGFNLYIKFNIGEAEIFGKFEKFGLELKPKFICTEIEKLKIEDRIRITGKIWNHILNWFKIKPGIYKTIMKEVNVFNELGQLKTVFENNIIEVIYSDNDIIKFKLENNTHIIKKPTYYWFNWYFEKIK